MAKVRIALVLTLFAVGCSRGPDLEKVPVGLDVQLTREDGGVVEGKLEARDKETVKVDTGPVTRSVARKDIAAVRVVDPNDKPAELPAIAKFRDIHGARRDEDCRSDWGFRGLGDEPGRR